MRTKNQEYTPRGKNINTRSDEQLSEETRGLVLRTPKSPRCTKHQTYAKGEMLVSSDVNYDMFSPKMNILFIYTENGGKTLRSITFGQVLSQWRGGLTLP